MGRVGVTKGPLRAHVGSLRSRRSCLGADRAHHKITHEVIGANIFL